MSAEEQIKTYLDKLHDVRIIRYFSFFLLGGGGAVTPFLNLFFARQGLDGTRIGWILALGSFITLFAAPFWTRIHSETKRPLFYFELSLFLAGLVSLVLAYQTMFLWLVLFYAIRVFLSAGHIPVLDILTLQITDGTDQEYGSVRWWGSFGWAVIVLGTGWIIQQTSMKSIFFLYAIFSLITIFLLRQIRIPPIRQPSSEGKNQSGYLKFFGQILRTPFLLSLSLMLLITGLGNLGVLQFETLFLDKLGAKEGLIGIAGMVSATVEIAGMPLADKLIRKKSALFVLLIALGMNCVFRLLVYLFPSIWMIILTRAVGGIAFSFYTVALIKCISLHTESASTGMILMFMTIIIPSFINIAFMPAAGYIYDQIGPHILYVIAVAGYLAGTIVLAIPTKRKMRHI